MYIAPGDERFDSMSLRQGDILQGVPFPLMDDSKMRVFVDIAGEWDYNSINSLTPKLHRERNDDEWATVVAPVRFGFCAILANCCDLELHAGRMHAHTVAAARLHLITGDLRNNPERFASLRANKDPRNPIDPGYIDYFYMEQHALLLEQDWKVHFDQVVSLPTGDMTRLLGRKILQLDDRTRVKFKIKLGFTYMRLNTDELNSGLENPWQAEPPQNG